MDIWDPSVATEIMVAIEQVFGDTNYEDDFQIFLVLFFGVLSKKKNFFTTSRRSFFLV